MGYRRKTIDSKTRFYPNDSPKPFDMNVCIVALLYSQARTHTYNVMCTQMHRLHLLITTKYCMNRGGKAGCFALYYNNLRIQAMYAMNSIRGNGENFLNGIYGLSTYTFEFLNTSTYLNIIQLQINSV